MVSVKKARREILRCLRPLSPRWVSLYKKRRFQVWEAGGLFAARAIRSPENIPAFDNSSRDGYAVRLADVRTASPKEPASLRIVGESLAGRPFRERLRTCAAVRIATGAAIPKGAQAVVMQENAREYHGSVFIKRSAKPAEHIRRKGSDVKVGDVLVPKEALLTATRVSLLASVGIQRILIHPPPRAAILSTGDELRNTAAPRLDFGQIRDSAGPFLESSLRALHATPISLGICPDKLGRLRERVKKALRLSDVVIITAGVSVGKKDFVRRALNSCGVRVVFWGVSMKPGKPFLFGMYGRKPVFGLPGNPVSVAVTFQLFVVPALLRLSARDTKPAVCQARLSSFAPGAGPRRNFVRVKIQKRQKGFFWVRPLAEQESHHLRALAEADGLVAVPENSKGLRRGSRVLVDLLG